MTLDDALHTTTKRLSAADIDTASLDASILVCHATSRERLELITHGTEELNSEEIEYLEELVQRREQREPIAYIVGQKEFWGHHFKVCPGVLVPRPDTETLVATLLALLPEKEVPMTLADVGVGSGCILLSLLKELPQAYGYGIDTETTPLSVTADNALALEVAERLTLYKGNLAEPLKEPVNVIVSNPPYIATDVLGNLAKEVREHEPKQALDGGEDGLAVYRSLIPSCHAKLISGGLLLLEIGYDQATTVADLLSQPDWSEVHLYQDLNNQPRVIAAVKG